MLPPPKPSEGNQADADAVLAKVRRAVKAGAKGDEEGRRGEKGEAAETRVEGRAAKRTAECDR